MPPTLSLKKYKKLAKLYKTDKKYSVKQIVTLCNTKLREK